MLSRTRLKASKVARFRQRGYAEGVNRNLRMSTEMGTAIVLALAIGIGFYFSSIWVGILAYFVIFAASSLAGRLIQRK